MKNQENNEIEKLKNDISTLKDDLEYQNYKLIMEMADLWKKLKKIVFLSLINIICLIFMMFDLPENFIAFFILLFLVTFAINLLYIFRFAFFKFIE